MQLQTSLTLFIPNQPLPRQGKSLDCVLACPVDITVESCKMPEHFGKSHLSEAEKHPDFPVTSCHHFDTTNADFNYIKSE